MFVFMVCNSDVHEAIKANPTKWNQLEFKGNQFVPECGDEPAETYEVRNCTCGSTLYKLKETHHHAAEETCPIPRATAEPA